MFIMILFYQMILLLFKQHQCEQLLKVKLVLPGTLVFPTPLQGPFFFFISFVIFVNVSENHVLSDDLTY